MNESQSQVHSLVLSQSSLEAEKNELLVSKEDVLNTLASKDDMIATLNKSFEEREKALRQNLSSMQTSSKQKIQELNHIVENLRAEIVHKTAESDSLKVQCDNLEKERSSLAVSYPSLLLCCYIY